MKNEDSDNNIWSGLKTVSSFDNGDNNATMGMGLGMTDVQECQHFSPTSLLVESLIDQLCKMIEKDPLDQKTLYLMICDKLHRMKLIDTSYHVEEFEFMRNHYQRALYNLLSVAKTNHRLGKISRGENGNDTSSPSSATASFTPPVYPNVPSIKLDLELSPPESVLEWSRYANEFVELEFIARGGFGQVYKARHKLDDTLYAVKKIHLRYQNANGFLRSLKEVKMLACLNHPNIVAYKAAWLEPFDNRSSSVKHNRAPTRAPAAVIIDDNTESPVSVAGGETDESSDIVFEKSKSAINSNKINTLKDFSVVPTDTSSSPSNLAVCKYGEKLNQVTCAWNVSSLKQDWATLYVQMQLCEENMREWLNRRNRLSSSVLAVDDHDVCGVVDINLCLSVFIRVLKGIEYIHEKGIIHHDIKPSNIFVSKDLRQVQVGDFGLACCLLSHSAVPLVQQQSTQHEGRIGTKLYAAPEQINGVCSPKSDIYSCGIILLELIRPFQTEMERSKIISHLKRGQIPTDVTAKWPHLVKIISETVTTPVSRRPTASELLDSIQSVNCYGDSSLSSPLSLSSVADSIINKKDELIFRLREEIAAKDQEILRLKQQLASRCDGFSKPKH